MKATLSHKHVLIAVVLCLSNLITDAQIVPATGFNYQAIVRDSSGGLYKNQVLNVRFSITKVDTINAVVYQETHAVQTNEFGLFTAIVGAGNFVSGSFSGIVWGNLNEHYLGVEIDLGSGYVIMGSSELTYVPLSFYAKKAGVAEAPWIIDSAGISYLGRVAINTINPISDLQIQQSGGTGGNEASGGITLVDYIAKTNHWRIYNSNPFLRFNFSDDGGIAYTPKAYVYDVDGSWNQLSDASLKSDIEPLGPVLSKILNLEPLKYHYLDNPDSAKKSIGFFAQEVQKLFPEVVSHEEGEKLLGIDYSKFAVIAIKAIQEQQQIIETLEKRIAALESGK